MSCCNATRPTDRMQTLCSDQLRQGQQMFALIPLFRDNEHYRACFITAMAAECRLIQSYVHFGQIYVILLLFIVALRDQI